MAQASARQMVMLVFMVVRIVGKQVDESLRDGSSCWGKIRIGLGIFQGYNEFF
jgi:hypothetical protein